MSALRKESNVGIDGQGGRMLNDHGGDISDDDGIDGDEHMDGLIPSTATAFPTTEFSSIEEAVETCRSIAIAAGFALSIRRSNKDKLRAMVCDRNGASVPRGAGLRATGSRRIGCPFLLKIRRYGSASNRVWVIVVDKNVHNHELTPGDMSSHCMARKLTTEQLEVVEKLHMDGFRPRQILQGLKEQFPDTLAVRGDIYNALANIRRKFSVTTSAPPFHATSPNHRLCSNCKEEGHDVRACPHANLTVSSSTNKPASESPLLIGANNTTTTTTTNMPPRVPTPRTSTSSTPVMTTSGPSHTPAPPPAPVTIGTNTRTASISSTSSSAPTHTPSAPLQPLRPMVTPLPTKLIVSQNTVVSLSNEITSFLTRVLAWPPSTQSAVLQDFQRFTQEMNRKYGPDGAKPQIISTPPPPPPAPVPAVAQPQNHHQQTVQNHQNNQGFDNQRRMTQEPIRRPLSTPRQQSVVQANQAGSSLPPPRPPQSITPSTAPRASPGMQSQQQRPGGLHLPVTNTPSGSANAAANKGGGDTRNMRPNVPMGTPQAQVMPSLAPTASPQSTGRKQSGRVCGNCRQSGHNTRTCTLPPSAKRKRTDDDQGDNNLEQLMGNPTHY